MANNPQPFQDALPAFPMTTQEDGGEYSTSNQRASAGGDTRSIRMSKQSVDLRLLDYVSSVDNNLMCPICHCPLIRPRRLDCDHVFCQECLDTAKNTGLELSSRCPTCRRRVDEGSSLPIPRILLHMLDDLAVKCPNALKGCNSLVKRGEVRDHVALYCSYAEVDCPLDTCTSMVWRKDTHRGCLHVNTVCDFCRDTMLERDLEEHMQLECPKREATCEHCNATVLYRDLSAHKIGCPEMTCPCTASNIGCKFVCKRTDLASHTSSCPLVALQPFLLSQKERLDQQGASIQLLQRKTDILEGGLASVQAMLGNTVLDSDTATMEHPSVTLASLDNTDAIREVTTVDSSTQHLLSLHESLREEVNRVSVAVSELDARSNMMIMNETLRRKEEMAHTNAAVNSMRVQFIHWFYNVRTQAQARYATSAGAGPSTASQPSGMSGKTGLPAEPVRRSSDSTRQETKL